jgi:hypothetical protein
MVHLEWENMVEQRVGDRPMLLFLQHDSLEFA